MDFDNSWKILKPEGLIFLHDGNPETRADTDPNLCGDAWAAIREITEMETTEAFTFNYHPGLTLIRKRVNWGPQK